MKRNDIKVWNPLTIMVIGILFSYVPAGIMYVINSERLGQVPSKKNGIIIVITSFIVLILLYLIYYNSFVVKIYSILNTGISFFFYRTQINIYKEFVIGGGKKASVFKPILISLLFVVFTLGLWFVINKYKKSSFEKRVEMAIGYLYNEKNTEADKVISDLLIEEPDNSYIRYLKAMSYYNQQYDELALREIEISLLLDPNNEIALKLKKLILSNKKK